MGSEVTSNLDSSVAFAIPGVCTEGGFDGKGKRARSRRDGRQECAIRGKGVWAGTLDGWDDRIHPLQ